MNKIAQIEKLLGQKPDGIWDAKDQAALNVLKNGDKSGPKAPPRVPLSNLTQGGPGAGPQMMQPPGGGGGFSPPPGLMQ